MISISQSVRPATCVAASSRLSRTPRQRGLAAVLCSASAAILCCAASIASAQAHYTQKTLGSGFSLPSGVAVDAKGNVYVADAAHNAVKEMLAVNGSIPPSPTIVTLGSGFKEPEGVTVDSSGNVYVADTMNGAVKEMLAVNGSIPPSPTIRTLTSIVNPYDVAVDGSGDVYLTGGCPTGNNYTSCGGVVELLAVNGSIPTNPTEVIFNGSFGNPIGIALDSSGDVYVGDERNKAVKEIVAVNGSITPASTIETLYVFTGAAGPSGVAVDSAGNVYVADMGTNALYELLAVNGTIPPSPTVETLASDFFYPGNVALDQSADVYVADALNNRVVELVP